MVDDGAALRKFRLELHLSPRDEQRRFHRVLTAISIIKFLIYVGTPFALSLVCEGKLAQQAGRSVYLQIYVGDPLVTSKQSQFAPKANPRSYRQGLHVRRLTLSQPLLLGPSPNASRKIPVKE